jgi:clan AA aspartic protease (TIGR02281 family)
MQKLWGVTIVYAAISLCCLGQPVSELRADNRVFPGGMISGADTAPAASPVTEGTRLAQGGSENWKRMGETVVSGGDEPTKVQIRGNSVLVPVTLVYGGNEVDVHLLLDTGAAATTIHTEIADQLSMNLSKARKVRLQVVGGGVIEASVVKISSLTLGPHTKRNWDVVVVPHKGSAARYDGLLGMDVLRGLKYRVDFKKQVIVWE